MKRVQDWKLSGGCFAGCACEISANSVETESALMKYRPLPACRLEPVSRRMSMPLHPSCCHSTLLKVKVERSDDNLSQRMPVLLSVFERFQGSID